MPSLTISPLFVLLAGRRNLLEIDTNLGYVAVCGVSKLLRYRAGGAIEKEVGYRHCGDVLRRVRLSIVESVLTPGIRPYARCQRTGRRNYLDVISHRNCVRRA